MSRTPKVVLTSDGDAITKVRVPRSFWLLVEAQATKWGIDRTVSCEMLLGRIGALFERGDAMFLGPDIQEILKRVRSDNFGMLSSGPPIELHRLHRSDKVKSGYTGVYASGQGFRAMGRVPNASGWKYIGQFDTAEEAAWRRRLYYKEHGLPYGDLEIELDKLRKLGFKGDDESALREIREYDASVGIYSAEPGEENDATRAKNELQGGISSNSKIQMLGIEGPLPPELQEKLDARRNKAREKQAAAEAAMTAKILAARQQREQDALDQERQYRLANEAVDTVSDASEQADAHADLEP